MLAITEELRRVGVFYVATVDAQGQPHVRPFGAAAEFDGKTYLCTNNKKDCYRQMLDCPKIEISGAAPDGTWIRLTATVKRDDRDEARAAMLEQNEGLKAMYAVGDGIFEVLSLEDAHCTRYSFTAPPVVLA